MPVNKKKISLEESVDQLTPKKPSGTLESVTDDFLKKKEGNVEVGGKDLSTGTTTTSTPLLGLAGRESTKEAFIKQGGNFVPKKSFHIDPFLAGEELAKRHYIDHKLTHEDFPFLAFSDFGKKEGLDKVYENAKGDINVLQTLADHYNQTKNSDIPKMAGDLIQKYLPDVNKDEVVASNDPKIITGVKDKIIDSLNKRKSNVSKGMAWTLEQMEGVTHHPKQEEIQKQVSDIDNEIKSVQNTFGTLAVNSKIATYKGEGYLVADETAKEIGKLYKQFTTPDSWMDKINTVEAAKKNAKETIDKINKSKLPSIIKSGLIESANNVLLAADNIDYHNESTGNEVILDYLKREQSDNLWNFAKSEAPIHEDIDNVQKALNYFSENQSSIFHKYPQAGLSQTSRLLGDKIYKLFGDTFSINSGMVDAAANEIQKENPTFMTEMGDFVEALKKRPNMIPLGGLSGGVKSGLYGIGQDVNSLFGLADFFKSKAQRSAEKINEADNTSIMGVGQAEPTKIIYDNEGKTFQEINNNDYGFWNWNSASRFFGKGTVGLAEFLLLDKGLGGAAKIVTDYGLSGVNTLVRDVKSTESLLGLEEKAIKPITTYPGFQRDAGLYLALRATGSYDDEADKLIKDDSDLGSIKKGILSHLMTGLSFLSFKAIGISPTAAAEKVFVKSAMPDVLKLINDNGINAIPNDAFSDLFINKIFPKAVKTLKPGFQLGAANVLDANARAMLGNLINPKETQFPSLKQDLEGITSQMFLFGVLGLPGLVSSGNINRATKDAFYDVGLNPVAHEWRVKMMVDAGKIGQPQADHLIATIRTLAEEVRNARNETNNKGLPLSLTQIKDIAIQNFRSRYAKELQNTNVLKDAAPTVTDAEKKIKETKDKTPYWEVKLDDQGNAVSLAKDYSTVDETWRNNISEINGRTDINPDEKNILKQEEDIRHANEVGSLMRTEEKVYTDFDGTTFKDGKLTPLGEALKRKAANGEEINVLTSRGLNPDGTVDEKKVEEAKDFISKTLGISKDNVKAGLNPEGKAEHLAAETAPKVFYDDNHDNLKAAEGTLARVVDTGEPKVEVTPEQTIVDLVSKGEKLGGAEMAVKADPSQATEALRFIAQQAYGITETGEPAVGGKAPIENKTALEAAMKKFPTPESTLEKSQSQNTTVLPVRNDDFVRKYFTPEEQTTYADLLKTDKAKADEMLAAKKKEVAGGATSVKKTVVLSAPFYDTSIKNIEDADAIRNSQEYQAHQKVVSDIADKVGVKIVSNQPTIGGYENNEGIKIKEVSNKYEIEAKSNEDAELFASLVGSLAPENQETTILSNYLGENSDKHNANEIEVPVADLNKAVDDLKKAGITDYVIDQKAGTITMIDFNKGESADFNNKITNFVSESKNNIKDGTVLRPVESKLLTRDDRARIYEDAQRKVGSQQGGEDLSNLYEQAKQADRAAVERLASSKQRGSTEQGQSAQGKPAGQTNVGGGVKQGTGVGENEQSLVNNSLTTQEFFSNTVKGANQPKAAWKPLKAFRGVLKSIYNTWSKFRGGFDTHIETSIPAFRDTQIKKIKAITDLYKDGGLVIDLMGSEGGFGKTITATNPKVRSINLDMNPDMAAAHNKIPVKGADFVQQAFGEDVPLDDGTVVKKYVPEEKADVVHETMGFQFIKSDRKQFVDEIADNYVKPDGVVMLEEKVIPDSPQEWIDNEKKKDEQFKSKYYDKAAITKKGEEVLVGMKGNQATEKHLLEALTSRFNHVYQYWDSGNFKGYIASNDAVKAKAMLKAIGDTKTDFTSRDNLVKIDKEAPGKEKTDIEKFNEKTDKWVEKALNSKVVKAFSADLPGGTEAAGLTLKTIIKATGEAVKKAYAIKKDIEAAIEKGMIHMKKLWEENFKNDPFPEEDFRDALNKHFLGKISREDKKIVSDVHDQLSSGVKESAVIKKLMKDQGITKKEAQAYIDEANKVVEVPEVSKGLGDVGISKDSRPHDATLSNVYSISDTQSWKQSVETGLAKFAKAATKKGTDLYTEINNQVHTWLSKITKSKGKNPFNPTSEEIGAMAYHRADTIRQIGELETAIKSPLLIDKTAAEAALGILQDNLDNVNAVLDKTGEVAARAFGIRQILAKTDAMGSFEYRRMQLVKSNGGEELSPEQEKKLKDTYDKEQENLKKQQELFSDKEKEEEFQRRVNEEVANRLQYNKSNAIKRGKMSSETAEKVSKNLFALADRIEKFGKAKGAEGASKAGIDVQKMIADAIRYVATKIKEGDLPDIIAQALEAFSSGDKKTDDEVKTEVYDALDKAGLGNLMYSDQERALKKIGDLATEEKSTELTKSAVGQNLINDLANYHIDKGARGGDVLTKVHDDLKTLFPDITREQVRDAYLKEGDYRLDKKADLEAENKKARLEARSIAKLETDKADLEAERDLRVRHEASLREPSAEEQKLIDERDELVKKKTLTEQEKKRFNDLDKELNRIQSRQPKEAKPKGTPKEIERSDREKELLDKIKQETEAWKKEKQDMKDMEDQREKLRKEKEREQERIDDLTKKRDKLLKGVREKAKKGEPKVESPEIEKLKKEIEDADERLRKIEAADRKVLADAKKKSDSIAEREQRLRDLKDRGKVWGKAKSKTTKQIDSEIASLNKQIEDELNRQGITLEKGSREELAVKNRITDSHNDRINGLRSDIQKLLYNDDKNKYLSDEERAALNNANDILYNSYVDKSTAQERFDAIKKAEDNVELARKELANYSNLSDIKDRIGEAQRQLRIDQKDAIQEIMSKKYQKSLQNMINKRQRQIDRGEFVEKTAPAFDRREAATVRLEIERRKIEQQYRALGEKAYLASRSRIQKIASDIQLAYLAQLIGGVTTEVKVALSGLVKQPLETITRATTGQLATGLFPHLREAVGAEGFSMLQEAHRYRAGWGAIGAEGMRKIVEKSQKELDDADTNYGNVKNQADQIKQNGTKEEYDAFVKKDLAKALNRQQRAILNHSANSLYEWIGSNSWKDAADVFLHSASQIEELMGYATKTNFKELSGGDKVRFIIGSMGATHAVLKNFSARAEFAASFVARLENKLRHGVDIRSADELLKTANESFVNYMRGKYQEDSFLTDVFKRVTKAIGQQTSVREELNKLSQIAEAGARATYPIVRTPINIAKDAILEYTLGLPRALILHGGEAYKALKMAAGDGTPMNQIYSRMSDYLSNMDADRADLILRCYRKGGFALGMYALAATGVIGFGGFFNKYEKGARNTHVGEVTIGGVKLPKILAKFVLHTPLAMPALLWSNYERVYQKNKDTQKESNMEAHWQAIKEDVEAMMDEIPLFREVSISKQLKNINVPFGRTAMDISEFFDVDDNGNLISRKPYDFWDQIYMRTGLRSLVPTEQEYNQKVREDNLNKFSIRND